MRQLVTYRAAARIFGSALALGAILAFPATGAAAAVATEPVVVSVTPEVATNPVGQTHCVTATFTYAISGTPVTDGTGVIEVVDAITGEPIARTISAIRNGEVGLCYSRDTAGVDLITAFVDENGNLERDLGEPFDTATKVWVATTGTVTGGGHVPGASTTGYVAFGLNAKSTRTGYLGQCNVLDQALDVHVKCLDVLTLVRTTATHATFTGNATVNDVPTRYTIDVDDLGEPGAGRDTFKLETDVGYAVAAVLVDGNIQVRD